MAEQKKKNKKRRVRSYEIGKFTSTVTDGRGKAVKTGTGSTVKSRSFKKPKAAPKPAAKAAPRKKAASKSEPKTATRVTTPKITTTKLSPATTGRGRGDGLMEMARRAIDKKPARKSTPLKKAAPKPKPNRVGQGRPTIVGKNNAGVRPKQGPKDRKDIKGGLLNPLRSDEPLLSAACLAPHALDKRLEPCFVGVKKMGRRGFLPNPLLVLLCDVKHNRPLSPTFLEALLGDVNPEHQIAKGEITWQIK
jgi:hypothetical protein